MAKVSMKETDYYKSGRHLENLKKACQKGAELSKAKALERKQKEEVLYNENPKICIECGKPHPFEKRNNKCCSASCSIKISNRQRGPRTEEQKAKISAALKIIREYRCLTCNTVIETHRKRLYCNDTECRKEQKIKAAKLGVATSIKNNSYRGWKARTKEPSYPEKYFISLFENEKVAGWDRELKVGKWFIDFAFKDKMIALEIDGKQHELPERKASDVEKDAFLKLQNWEVIRIKWFNPVSEKNKNLLYPQIERLKEILGVG